MPVGVRSCLGEARSREQRKRALLNKSISGGTFFVFCCQLLRADKVAHAAKSYKSHLGLILFELFTLRKISNEQSLCVMVL
jgi:hypothetical protein